MSKILFRIGINTLIGVILIVLWMQIIDINEVMHALKEVNPLISLPVIACYVFVNILRAFRLKILLSGFNVRLKNLIYLNFLSQLLSFVIPIRAGEVTKGVYLSTHYDIPLAKAVVWIFLDRFFDFWLVVFLSLILLVMVPNALPTSLISSLLIVLVVFTGVTVLLVLIPDLFKRFAQFFAGVIFIPSVKNIFLKLVFFVVDTFGLIHSQIKNTPVIFLLTLSATVIEGFAWYLLLSVFIRDLSFMKVLLGSMMNALTFLIPAAPGYVGSAEAAGLGVFHYGLSLDKLGVSAATVVNHAITIVYMLIFGILGLYLLKFDLKIVFRKLTGKGK